MSDLEQIRHIEAALSNELPYLPFFVSDFLVTVSTWPAERVGAYALALFYQFEQGGLPADNEAELARIFHVTRVTARRLWMEIGHKFIRHEDGLWWNQRLEEVRATARAQVAKASERGKRGAAGRWGKGANGIAQALPKQSLSNGTESKEKSTPPLPPSARGARPTRAEKKLEEAIRRSDPYGHADKMREVDRLVASGMDWFVATRQVFK